MAIFDVFGAIGKRVSLETKAPAVLSREVVGDFVAILDYASAAVFTDVLALHQRVYPYLPDDVPDNPTMYPYCKIVEARTGNVVVVGLPWIDLNNSKVITELVANVTVQLKTMQDVDLLRRSLHSNGFDNFEIKLKE